MVLNKLVRLNSETYAISDNGKDEEKFDPDKTIYDLRLKSINEGEFAICIKDEKISMNSMILYEGEIFWVATESLEIVH